MKIAHFHTNTIFSGWSNLAIPATLKSMGHEVIEASLPGSPHRLSIVRSEYEKLVAETPTIEDLSTCDVILISGPEYLSAWLEQLYGFSAWAKLSAAKIAVYVESSQREDHPFDFSAIHKWADVHFYPDHLDAERNGGQVTPSGVDITTFRPLNIAKEYEAAFCGSMYDKRREFVKSLLPHLKGISFKAGAVSVYDLGGECQRAWTELYVRNLNQIKVHVALPSNNMRITVCRPFETLACGTFLLTYKTDDGMFRDGEHCRFYDPEKPEALAELIRYYLEHAAEREQLARQGRKHVLDNYSLEHALTAMLRSAPCR